METKISSQDALGLLSSWRDPKATLSGVFMISGPSGISALGLESVLIENLQDDAILFTGSGVRFLFAIKGANYERDDSTDNPFTVIGGRPLAFNNRIAIQVDSTDTCSTLIIGERIEIPSGAVH